MTEHKLQEYLQEKISLEEFRRVLGDSRMILNDDDDSFEVTKNHLIKLCNDLIYGNISALDLETISNAFIFSNVFFWDASATDGKITSEMIFAWNNPEITYDINVTNVILWKEYLLSGKSPFAK